MGRTALLVVDMLNAYDHVDSDALAGSVEETVPTIADLIARAEEGDVPVVYVNDNFGNWSDGRDEIVERVLAGRRPDLVEPIVPHADFPFVVKARHSAFYETPLEYLLRQSGVTRVVVTGQVAEQCIFYSALDAYIRHFEVVVPRDGVAHIHQHLADAALEMMQTNMRAEVVTADACLGQAVSAGTRSGR